MAVRVEVQVVPEERGELEARQIQGITDLMVVVLTHPLVVEILLLIEVMSLLLLVVEILQTEQRAGLLDRVGKLEALVKVEMPALVEMVDLPPQGTLELQEVQAEQ